MAWLDGVTSKETTALPSKWGPSQAGGWILVIETCNAGVAERHIDMHELWGRWVYEPNGGCGFGVEMWRWTSGVCAREERGSWWTS